MPNVNILIKIEGGRGGALFSPPYWGGDGGEAKKEESTHR